MRRDDVPAQASEEGLTLHDAGRTLGGWRARACIILIAALVAGCGGDEDEGTQSRPADPDTAGLPDYMRKTVACLRESGVKVRVPPAVRRLVKRGEFKGKTPQGVEAGFLSFLLFDEKQRFTEAQFRAARKCYDER